MFEKLIQIMQIMKIAAIESEIWNSFSSFPHFTSSVKLFITRRCPHPLWTPSILLIVAKWEFSHENNGSNYKLTANSIYILQSLIRRGTCATSNRWSRVRVKQMKNSGVVGRLQATSFCSRRLLASRVYLWVDSVLQPLHRFSVRSVNIFVFLQKV